MLSVAYTQGVSRGPGSAMATAIALAPAAVELLKVPGMVVVMVEYVGTKHRYVLLLFLLFLLLPPLLPLLEIATAAAEAQHFVQGSLVALAH